MLFVDINGMISEKVEIICVSDAILMRKTKKSSQFNHNRSWKQKNKQYEHNLILNMRTKV
jgi:hypothetical protein